MFESLRTLFRGSTLRDSGTLTRELGLLGQEHAERGSRESEEHFERLVGGVQDYAIFLLDPTGVILTWNAGAERIKGYRAEEIIGQHFSRFYPKEMVAVGWPAHELSVATSTGRFEEEAWRVRKDGSRFWANVVITALRNENGTVRGFLKITRDLTDRKQAEEKLRLSEERFRLMVEGVQDYAIFMLDPQGHVASWNTGAQRIKGYTADEIIGQHLSCLYPPEAQQQGWPEEGLRRATAEGHFEDEGWRIRKDGSKFWASIVLTALKDEAGALHGFAKVTRDLTERRASEENARRLLQEEAARKASEDAAREIQREREQLRVTLSSIGDAVIVTDKRGIVTFLNPVAESLTGWGISQAVDEPLHRIFNILNEETRERVDNPVDRVLKDGVIVGLANHTVLIARDGREIPIDDSGAPIRGLDESIIGVVLVFRDVTESRRAIEARLYLASIVESSDDAIIGKTLDGKIASWNRGAARLYGYTADEIVGQPLSILVPSDHPDELPAIMDRIKRGEFIEHFETVRVRKDGSRVDVSLTISPVRNAEGKIIGASKVARDITARKEEGRRRNEFIALLAHELRNPLAPLRNALQVIRLAGNDRNAIDQSRVTMERQLQHLVRLVDDLLDVSRITEGKLQLRKERITVAAIVDNALEICKGMFPQQENDLTVSVPDEEIFIDADKTRIAQALCNLLSNAVKYSDRGSRVWLTVRRVGSNAEFSVKDSGIGISAQMLPTVFDLFTQVDRSLEKSQGGLGVGLTIVKRLVELHGGNVEARSEGDGRGSEFVMRLPIALSVMQESTEDPDDSGLQGSKVRRVLVVDDNVDAASTLTTMLKLMGHELRTAHDGLEAVETAAAFRPDVILLDIGMPRLNGYDTCRRMREQAWGQQARILALTGWGQDEDRRRSEEAGFDGHLVKPVEPAAIEKLLAELRSESA